MVNDMSKAHIALRSAHFPVSGSGSKRKAWIRLGSDTVKLDIHQDPGLLASIHAEETVERIHIARPGLILALTLQGLGTASRRGKVTLDVDTALSMARWLLDESIAWREDLATLVTTVHRQNWEQVLSPAKHFELFGLLRQATDLVGSVLSRSGGAILTAVRFVC